MKNSNQLSKLRKRILGEKRSSKPSKPQSRRLLIESLEGRRLLAATNPLPLFTLDGITGFRLVGVAAYDNSGVSVSSAGDVNGDGFDDLIVGAFGADPNGTDSGSSYVVFGGNFTGGVETQVGGDGNDTLTATQGAGAIDILIGGRGDDILISDGGDDVLIGGQGDDVLAIPDVNFSGTRRLVGGNGNDTLRLDGSGLTLDLTAIPNNRIVDIEIIDITGSGNNSLTLTALEVLKLSSTTNTLIVRRNVGDVVNIGTGWIQSANETIGTDSFAVFTQGQAVLKVHQVNATIAGRSIFYNNAPGTNFSSAGAADNAIDTSKSALRTPGATSTFANYTNYSRGLTGIIVDIAGLPPGVTDSQMLASLQFARWNGIDVGGFAELPGAAVPTVTVLAGSGVGGSARVKITFPDDSLRNTWLRVTVLADATTALASNDVFYFGHVLGDTGVGNTETRLRVNATDTGAVRSNQSTASNSVGVTNIYDINRDGRVNATDTGLVRSNQQTAGIVAPLMVPLSPAPPVGVSGNSASDGDQSLLASPLILPSNSMSSSGSSVLNVLGSIDEATTESRFGRRGSFVISRAARIMTPAVLTTQSTKSPAKPTEDLAVRLKDDVFAGLGAGGWV